MTTTLPIALLPLVAFVSSGTVINNTQQIYTVLTKAGVAHLADSSSLALIPPRSGRTALLQQLVAWSTNQQPFAEFCERNFKCKLYQLVAARGLLGIPAHQRHAAYRALLQWDCQWCARFH